MTLIAERPPEAADRAVHGHWEGDLAIGKDDKSTICNVLSRKIGYLILGHLTPGFNHVDAVHDGLIRKMVELGDLLRGTSTWDQGVEIHPRREAIIAGALAIYLCDPHPLWQQPTNENTNGLLRQYFPKGNDLSAYPQEDLDQVAWEMHDRPRQRLNYLKPNEMVEPILLC